jgi:hypothetical protein
MQLYHAMRHPKEELGYDEVDRVGEKFEHRVIFSSGSELSIVFASVELHSHPVSGRTVE